MNIFGSNRNDVFRYRRERLPGQHHTTWTWTLLDNPRDVDVQWEIVADNIRAILRASLPTVESVYVYVKPNPDVDTDAQPRQFISPRRHWARDITGSALLDLFQAMLQSDKSLAMPGMVVLVVDGTLRIGGITLPRGYGRRPSRNTPPEKKRFGMTCHPDEHAAPMVDGYCGVRAFLFMHDPTFNRQSYTHFCSEAEALARYLNIPPDMQSHHFRLLVERFTDVRIVLFTSPWAKLQFVGAEWRWPHDLPCTKWDDNTIAIYYVDQHYWPICTFANFRNLMAKGSNSRTNVCRRCFSLVQTEHMSLHDCPLPSNVHQCAICMRVFDAIESFEQHLSERRTNYPSCEICNRTVFNGPSCEALHRTTACVPAPNVQHAAATRPKIECLKCGFMWLPASDDSVHDCARASMPCSSCHKRFSTKEELIAHSCQLSREDRFWAPVVVPERTNAEQIKPTVWNSHWAYDFETTRAVEQSADVFQHEVLSWSMQLMQPDFATMEFVDEADVLHEIHTRVNAAVLERRIPSGTGLSIVTVDLLPWSDDQLRAHRGAEFRTLNGSVRISGTRIETFLWIVENICRHLDADGDWRPTLWAHNGSKFDAKFIFDHYVNVLQYQLAGDSWRRDYNNAMVPATSQPPGAVIKWVHAKYRSHRKNVLQVQIVGSRMLKLQLPDKIVFKCSAAHHACPLRALPKTFALSTAVRKGEFPYGRLKADAWGSFVADGLPPLVEYDIDAMPSNRRDDVVRWWIEDSIARNSRVEYMTRCLRASGVDYVEQTRIWPPVLVEHDPRQPVRVWKFDDEMWAYLHADVAVLAAAMEAYHRRAEDMHRGIARACTPNGDVFRLVSPLDCSTAPGWAFAMYCTWFQPADTVYLLKKNAHNFVRDSLRGGRTDKRCNYVDVTRERRDAGDKVVYVDFCSLYPSVQKCDVHDTYFPVGRPFWYREAFKDDDWLRAFRNTFEWQLKHVMLVEKLQDWTGFIEISCYPNDAPTHPVLHTLGRPANREESEVEPERLLFSNDIITKTTYALPELLHAMDVGDIRIMEIHDMLLFRRGTNVFEDYVSFFYKLKDDSDKTGCAPNPGLRNLAKLLLNSLWGKLGQRSYPVREWVTDNARIDYLCDQFATKAYELLSFVREGEQRVHLTYRKHNDTSNMDSTAPHIAAFVSMWGRVVLHKKLLHEHGQRALYCDTDSAIVYMRPGDTIPWIGNKLGDLTDEVPEMVEKAGYKPALYPDLYISEVVALAPKTYAIRIRCDQPHLDVTKVVCKGFEPSHRNAANVCFNTFKELIFAKTPGLRERVQRKRGIQEDEETFDPNKENIASYGHLQFMSNLASNRPAPTERHLDRVMTGRYTKGQTHPHEPRLVVPFCDGLQPEGYPTDTFLSFAHPTAHYK